MATKPTFPNCRHFFPRRRRPLGCAKAWSSGGTNGRDHYGGRLVGANVIVLRMRMSVDDQPPSEWMEWEKQYFVRYNEDVLEGIGLLQNYLMNTRSSLALGLVALLTMSVEGELGTDHLAQPHVLLIHRLTPVSINNECGDFFWVGHVSCHRDN